jgi:hypothetical protein
MDTVEVDIMLNAVWFLAVLLALFLGVAIGRLAGIKEGREQAVGDMIKASMIQEAAKGRQPKQKADIHPIK